MSVRYLISTAILAFSGTVGAYAGSFQHAELAFEGADVVAAVNASGYKVQPGVTTVYCQAVVGASGTTPEAACYTEQADSPLADTVASAVEQQDFWPAHVNGKAVPVRLNFRVVLHSQGNAMSAAMLPNLGVMQAQYGPNYVEPQERLDKASWYDALADQGKSAPFFAHADGRVRVAATVETSGQAREVGIVEADRAYRRQAKAVTSSLGKAHFIPGSVNGKTVDMPYMAVISFDKE